MIALLNLFCIKYTTACKKRRKYILYFGINYLTESVNYNIPLFENKNLIENIANKINILYKEIKKMRFPLKQIIFI